MQFDKDGDGKLDETETKLLKEDVIKNLSEAISAVLGNIVSTVIAAFGIYTVGSIALKAILAKAGFGVAAVGAGAIGASVFSVAAIAAVVAAGVFKLADNAATAFEDATTDEFGKQQDFSAKEFVARLLGGKNTEGGWMNAIMNAWDKALIGAAAGAAIGGIPTGGIGAPLGAAIGFLVGGVSGALLGKEGSDGIAEFIDMVDTGFSDLMSDIGSWFSETRTGKKNAVTSNEEVYIHKNKLKSNL